MAIIIYTIFACILRVWNGINIIAQYKIMNSVVSMAVCAFTQSWNESNDYIQTHILTHTGTCTHILHIYVKGEVRSCSNLISEERVKFSEQNSENVMKIGWKIRKLWHFEVSQIFRKHFLTSRYEYANERVDDVITSLLAIYFVHKILKFLIFCPNLW